MNAQVRATPYRVEFLPPLAFYARHCTFVRLFNRTDGRTHVASLPRSLNRIGWPPIVGSLGGAHEATLIAWLLRQWPKKTAVVQSLARRVEPGSALLLFAKGWLHPVTCGVFSRTDICVANVNNPELRATVQYSVS